MWEYVELFGAQNPPPPQHKAQETGTDGKTKIKFMGKPPQRNIRAVIWLHYHVMCPSEVAQSPAGNEYRP